MARAYGQVCPIARALDIVGERWTLLIIRELFIGRTRFSELTDGLPGIPSRMLSARLKKLEEYGFVERSVYRQHPLRAEYRLTEEGESLKPVLDAFARWGIERLFNDEERRDISDEMLDHFVRE